MQVRLGQTRIRLRIARVELDRPLVEPSGGGVALFRAQAILLAPTQDAIVGFRIVGFHARGRRAVGGDEFEFQGTDDLCGDVILDSEDIGKLAIVALGPKMAAGLPVDKLRGPPLIRCPDLRTLPSRT
jgi:hypothetical protein